MDVQGEILRKLGFVSPFFVEGKYVREAGGFVSHFLVWPIDRECEPAGFVGRGWRLYVLGNKTEIAHEHPIGGFVSHFLFSRWRTFSLIAGRLRIRSLTLHCFYSMAYCIKSIGRRYYCCGDLVENKRQI
jgi:hypothetical protein